MKSFLADIILKTCYRISSTSRSSHRLNCARYISSARSISLMYFSSIALSRALAAASSCSNLFTRSTRPFFSTSEKSSLSIKKLFNSTKVVNSNRRIVWADARYGGEHQTSFNWQVIGSWFVLVISIIWHHPKSRRIGMLFNIQVSPYDTLLKPL